eukprot:TRINITY_DN23893_c0_g1_i1.p1 TRINITY_DN23893_c0_g1~~TRINITY_DN23893_c0_g1_i1.p1  ORF type:complete len:410 (+),score=47.25 TRINITY_DN23893_c0_g1_i1:118-1230(+)
MAVLLTSHPSLLFRNPKNLRLSLRSQTTSLSIHSNLSTPRFSSLFIPSAFSGENSDKDPISGRIPIDKPSLDDDSGEIEQTPGGISDEWGEKSEIEAEEASYYKFSEADRPRDEDEWGRDEGSEDVDIPGNGSAAAGGAYDKLGDLKRCLVDTIDGTEYGIRATAEVRAEIVELINQLEAENPTTAPTQAPSLLDGNWVLLYTAFSELLPLIAAGTVSPLLKLKRICQEIDTGSSTIQNSATFSSPFATFSFSASASFEVRSPSRIQVQFKEGIFNPPEISSTINLPQSIDVFGQKIDLLPVQQSLNPIQEAAASISRTISGQSPLKIPIPGDRSQSWLLTTYLDEDLRISRGDGGLFVLVKQGSPLLDQ